MKDSSSNGSETLGVEAPPPPTVEVPTIEVIEKWMAKDIGSCITLLTAVQADKDLRLHMATFLHGRYQNMKNAPPAESDPRQGKLFPRPK